MKRINPILILNINHQYYKQISILQFIFNILIFKPFSLLYTFIHFIILIKLNQTNIDVTPSGKYTYSIKVHKILPDGTTIFKMQGPPAILNTLRRIIIDEVPTIAPDTLVMFQNTSVMVDEALASRLGLLPIMADPSQFEYIKDNINANNTIVYKLDITADDFMTVYSGDLQQQPIGDQQQYHFKYPNIPLVKLAPKQQLKFELYCHKGIGKSHAKWSPVSVCYYKMMQTMKIKDEESIQEIKCQNQSNKLAKTKTVEWLQQHCPVKDLFQDLEDINLEKCTLCRNCLGNDNIEMYLDDNNYFFIIEPVGYQSGIQIMQTALEVLKNKAQLVIDGMI